MTLPCRDVGMGTVKLVGRERRSMGDRRLSVERSSTAAPLPAGVVHKQSICARLVRL